MSEQEYREKRPTVVVFQPPITVWAGNQEIPAGHFAVLDSKTKNLIKVLSQSEFQADYEPVEDTIKDLLDKIPFQPYPGRPRVAERYNPPQITPLAR